VAIKTSPVELLIATSLMALLGKEVFIVKNDMVSCPFGETRNKPSLRYLPTYY
jgi:hypothetical protein